MSAAPQGRETVKPADARFRELCESGATRAKIAEELGISPGTVTNRRKRMGLPGRTGKVAA